MPRISRRVVVVLLLLGAWALVGGDRAPLPVTMSAAAATSSWEEEDEAPSAEKPAHDLLGLRIFTKVILHVKDNYVDPRRIKPREMMVAALEYVEKTVPDVIVDGSPDSDRLTVTAGTKTQTFDLSHIDSLWKLSFTMKDVFQFISRNMRPMEDTRDIEYAAVNGMLSKLDPHSVLMRPEVYREMKLTTKGEFGGLGFVIQMREGNLTVVRVLPGTPAFRAGIKKDDQIKKIGEESTINMDLNEAVSKLRGPVDSKVTITVERKSWERPQTMTLARAIITIESVQSKLLASNVGYVRLKNFQSNTTRDLQAALKELAKKAEPSGGLKGLVLDLRGNPGGLLDAAIQVSDLFLSQGMIVATVGLSDKLREEKRAHSEGDDVALPMAVLVNAGSASASEIVAGALKNLDRAVIVGRQTFGKGSVQVLYDFRDDSALKLTIAKYLTPGDVSIQEVGIVPDIDLVPTRVTKERLDVFAPRRSMGEADLDAHFGNPSSAVAATKREDVLAREKPAEQLKYLKDDGRPKETATAKPPAEAGKAPKAPPRPAQGDADPLLDTNLPGEELDDQLDAETQDEIKEDFEVLFARDFVLQAPSAGRQQMIQAGKAFVEEQRRDEQARIDAAISALGMDWSPGETPAGTHLVATVRPGPEQKLPAGELLELEVTVENRGTKPLHRVRGWTECPDNPYLDRRELLFGKLKPGEKRSWKVPIRMPLEMTSRRDQLTLKLFDESGPLGEPVLSELNFAEQPRPVFAFNWQVLDRCESCNGNGEVERGEAVDLLLDVTNTGTGKALDSFAQIKNAADQNIFIDKGRFKLGELLPGQTKTARFHFEVKRAYKGESFPLKVAIVDEKLEEFTTEKLQVPIRPQPRRLEAKKGLVKLADKATLYSAPAEDARVVAQLPRGALLASLGTSGDFVKVELDKERFAFAHLADARDWPRGQAALPRETVFPPSRIPPVITLSADSSQGGIVASGDHFTLSGTVTSEQPSLDMYVLVNDQKVFFQTVPTPGDEPAKINFSTRFALKEGNNNVLVVARESQDFASRRSLVIRRRPPALAQGATPSAPKKDPEH